MLMHFYFHIKWLSVSESGGHLRNVLQLNKFSLFGYQQKVSYLNWRNAFHLIH